MNLNLEKKLVLNCIKMTKEFVENNFQIIEMFIELNEFEILEKFFKYHFTNSITTFVLLSLSIDKLQEEN